MPANTQKWSMERLFCFILPAIIVLTLLVNTFNNSKEIMPLQSTDIPTGTVTAEWYYGSDDFGSLPVQGYVEFKSAAKLLKASSGNVGLLPASYKKAFDATGNLNISLPATDSTYLSPKNAAWTAVFHIQDPESPAKELDIDPISFLLPQGTTQNLTNLVPISQYSIDSGANYGFLNLSFGNGPDFEKAVLNYSPDGKFVTYGQNNPVYSPVGGVRDPNVVKIDDKWWMAYTINNGLDKALGLAYSTNLVDWTEFNRIDVSSATNILRAWAPELVKDTDGTWTILFTSVRTETNNPHDIYWLKSIGNDFAKWTAPTMIQWSGLSQGPIPIDPCAIRYQGKWYIFYGNAGGMQRATADTLTGTWNTDRIGDWAGWIANSTPGLMGIEGPEIVDMGGGVFRLYFDRYDLPDAKPIGYYYTESSDGMNTWTVPKPVTYSPGYPKGQSARHGTWLKLQSEADKNLVISAAGQAGRPPIEHAEFDGLNTAVAAGNIWNGNLVLDSTASFRAANFVDSIGSGQFRIKQNGVYSIDLIEISNIGLGGGWIAIKTPDQVRNIASNDVVAGAAAWSISASNVYLTQDTILKVFCVPNNAQSASNFKVRLRITRIQ